MSGWILLVIALASLAVVLVTAGLVGRQGWRLAKRGAAVSRNAGQLAAQLARKADEVSRKAAGLQANSEELSRNIARLQLSAARLVILFDAWDQALLPYRSVRSFFGR